MDYEAELAVVIKKECKNVDKEKALEYVLGYTAGNDISAREWQKTRGGGQWSFSKVRIEVGKRDKRNIARHRYLRVRRN